MGKGRKSRLTYRWTSVFDGDSVRSGKSARAHIGFPNDTCSSRQKNIWILVHCVCIQNISLRYFRYTIWSLSGAVSLPRYSDNYLIFYAFPYTLADVCVVALELENLTLIITTIQLFSTSNMRSGKIVASRARQGLDVVVNPAGRVMATIIIPDR